MRPVVVNSGVDNIVDSSPIVVVSMCVTGDVCVDNLDVISVIAVVSSSVVVASWAN